MNNGIFNNDDLYPTPQEIIYKMLQHYDVNGKVILEPSAGKGDIIDVLIMEGAKDILFCEKSEPLQKILNGKGRFLNSDFLQVTSDQISHINAIIMNPPFSDGVKHILHAYEIAPKGATIISLINSSNLKNDYTNDRKQLKNIVECFGTVTDLQTCFDTAERRTNVEVSMLVIQKPGESYEQEFEGFFMDEEPEAEGVNGIMPYDAIRDLVNRYVAAVKLYDEQLSLGVKMNNLLSNFYGEKLSFSCTQENKQVLRADFKKDMQKAGWKFIFDKLDLKQDLTKGTQEKINKFIEEQTNIPFTVKNIWQMLEIIVKTRGNTMNEALLEVFERITLHHHENRYNVKGWKTNLHYLVGKKFILPHQVNPSKEYGFTSETYSYMKSSYQSAISDLQKALCYITGENYNEVRTIEQSIDRNIYGEWYTSHFFKYKAYKNGNMHFEWVSEELWGRFNQKIAELKGFPLFETKEQTAYQKRNAGHKAEPKQKQEVKESAGQILFTMDI